MKYNAFISYKHAPLDIEVAKRIHSGLETFKIPYAIQKKYDKKNIKRVFRDQEELPIGSDLGNNISEALSESEYLIVICSPNTPGSYWVCKEIETFISMHDRDHVLAVLIEGEPNESFPEMLLKDENGNPVEPLAADLRGENTKEIKSKLKVELLRLAAPIIGCSYDDLRQRHRERRIKRLCTILCGVFMTTTLLGTIFAVYNANMAAKIDKNYKLALQNQYKYMSDMAKGLFNDGYRKDAVVIGLEVLSDEENDIYVPEAEYLLSEALYTYDSGEYIKKDDMLEHEVPVDRLEFDSDKCHLISSDMNNTVYLWDLKNNNSLLISVKPTDETSGRSEDVIEFDHIGDELIVCTENGVRGYSLSGDKTFSVDKEYCQEAIINSKNNIAILESVNEISVIDLKSHSQIKSFKKIDDNINYSFRLQYDEDKNVIYSTCSREDANAIIAAIDLKTDNISSYEVKKDYVAAITFSEDNYLFAASIDSKKMLEDVTKPYTIYLQKIDLNTSNEEWCYSTDIADGGINSSAATMLKYRKYEGEDGLVHKEAVLTANSKALCIDTDTGIALSETTMPGAIRSIPLAKNGPLGYAALSSGNIEILNYPDGNIMSDFKIETGLNIMDLKIADGIFAIKSYSSPDLLIMKYHTGKDIKQLISLDDGIKTVTQSPDGKSIAILTGYEGDTRLYFINEEGEVREADIIQNGIKEIEASSFTKDNKYYICCKEKSYLIDPLTMEKKEFSPELITKSITGIDVNCIKDYAVLYNLSAATIVDITSGKLVNSIDFETDKLLQARISPKGDKLYVITEENDLECIDINTGKISDVNNDIRPVVVSYVKTIAVGNTGEYLAVACKDGKLRVLSTKDGSELFSIDYVGYYNSFIGFSEDDTRLIIQGDDYHIYLYDVKNGKKIYASLDQYSSALETYELFGGKRFAVMTRGGILVLETDSYLPVAQIDEGCLITKDGHVLTKYRGNLYSFPFQTPDSLREAALDQFDLLELSEEKRTKYHLMNYEN